jgi:hypothetical protein
MVPAMPNMVSAEFEQILIAMHNNLAPEDEAWDEYLQRGERILKELNGDLSRMRVLTITDGGAPNVAQRNRLRASAGGGKIKSSVISDSMLVRVVVAIFSVFLDGVRVYRPTDWVNAFGNLELPPERHVEMTNVLRRLRTRLGTVRSLDPMLDGQKR